MRSDGSRTPRSCTRITAGSMPWTRPTATAASAFDRLWRPGTGRKSGIFPKSHTSMPRAVRRSFTPQTSADIAPRPYVTVRAVVRDAIAATRASCPFRITKPSPGSARGSAPFSAATPSSEPSPSRCAGPTLVTTPTFGRAMPQSGAISPRPLVPISTTSAFVDASARRIVSGTPRSLLKERIDWTTGPSGSRTFAIISRVLLLPLLPVTAITGHVSVRRCAAPRSASAFFGYLTRMSARSANSAGSGGASSGTIAADAPRRSASATNWAPSVRVPGRATKRSPSPASRESMVTRQIGRSAGRPSSAPPVTRAAPVTSNVGIEILPPARLLYLVAERSKSPLSGTERPFLRGQRRAHSGGRGFAVVEVHGLVREDLVVLVPLAEDRDAVADARLVHRARDRVRAVRLHPDVPRAVHAGEHVEDDPVGILRPRVVGREPRQVRQLRGGAPHARALRAVAVAAAADHRDDAPRDDTPQVAQHVLHRVVGVRVVDDDREGLPRLDRLETSADAAHRREPRCRFRGRGAKARRDRGRGEQVHQVVAADQRARHLGEARRRDQRERDAFGRHA